jgi:hypothetical protein
MQDGPTGSWQMPASICMQEEHHGVLVWTWQPGSLHHQQGENIAKQHWHELNSVPWLGLRVI